ncbi:MAG: endonuclease [Lentimicrobiaceae bacterium]|nr:endonuclease [Lentimicrobiaceae bacterium]
MLICPRILIIIVLSVFSFLPPAIAQSPERLRIMFYNTENLFDPFGDSISEYNAFTARGEMYWTFGKFSKKIINLYKTIVAVGEWNAPCLVGLCEIENRFVLNWLTRQTPLSQFGYRIIQHDSPDRRGIDVALLYRAKQAVLLHEEFLRISIPGDSIFKTRDVLYAKFLMLQSDTLHVFVVHLPSKIGGAVPTSSKRESVAIQIIRKTDSVFRHNGNSNIVIMGDFNDSPSSNLLTDFFEADKISDNIAPSKLYNLMEKYKNKPAYGTHKFRGNWTIIDQILVSGNLLLNNNFFIVENKAYIFSSDFLLEDDPVNTGKKPFRTYEGFRYKGGFSDHLPVYTDIIKK